MEDGNNGTLGLKEKIRNNKRTLELLEDGNNGTLGLKEKIRNNKRTLELLEDGNNGTLGLEEKIINELWDLWKTAITEPDTRNDGTLILMGMTWILLVNIYDIDLILGVERSRQ
jgi:predicted neutral ceramidase superfamily lipid hydrolase